MNVARMQDHPEVELQTVAVGTKAGKVTFDFGMAHAADTVADPNCASGRSAPHFPASRHFPSQVAQMRKSARGS